MTKCKDMPGCVGCPMLKVNTTYENVNEGKVHYIGGEQEFLPPDMGPGERLVISENPSYADVAAKRQMADRGTNYLFDKLTRKAGIDRNALTILNSFNCHTPNNISPADDKARGFISKQDAATAAAHCYRAYVEPVLRKRAWERIDTLGETALTNITGKVGVMKWRGSPLPKIGDWKETVVPSMTPAYLTRDQSMQPTFVSDLKKGTQVPPEYYNLNPTVADLAGFRATTFCFDIETNRYTNEITMIGISSEPYKVLVCPMKGAYLDEIKRIFRDALHVIGQNIIGFDLPRMATAGCPINPDAQVWDIMLMQHLLQPDVPHDLEYISSVFTQKPAWKHLSTENMALYCARDVDTTFMSYNQLKPNLTGQGLEDLYKYTQVPLQRICSMAQETGITVDGARIAVVREQKLKEIEELEKQLPPELAPFDKAIKKRIPAPEGTRGKSGKPVKFLHVPATERVRPWNSDAAVKRYLYELKGYPVQKNSKTGAVSTDKKALLKLWNRTKDPAIAVLQKLSKLSTLVSGFLKDDGKRARGKVHTHLSVVGTNSGRLSSADPNMQNQPPATRFTFVPSDPSWCFIEADFSSGENRLTALYANDQDRLRRLATPGFNEHKRNASIFFGIPEEEIEKSADPDLPYAKGKKINHGMNYGEGFRKIAQDNDLDEREVKQAIQNWRMANPLTVQWQERTTNTAAREGVLTNAFGRKRWFWSTNTYTESLAFLPQSTLADIIFRAMIGLLYERINWSAELAIKASPVLAPLPYPAQFLLQVHDSLLFEGPPEIVPLVVDAMKKTLEQPWTQLGGYSFPAEFKVGAAGASWGELESYK